MAEETWRLAYQVTVAALALSMLLRLVLFAILRPRGRLEWATVAAAAGQLAWWAMLVYWLVFPGAVRAVVHPPLVVAAWLTLATSVAFTSEAWREWHRGRMAGS